MSEKEILSKKKKLEEIRMLRESKVKLLSKASSSLSSSSPVDRVSTLTAPPSLSSATVEKVSSITYPPLMHEGDPVPSTSSPSSTLHVVAKERDAQHHVDTAVQHCSPSEAGTSSSEIPISVPSLTPPSSMMATDLPVTTQAQEEGKEVVVVVPRNGFDILRAWDAMDQMEDTFEVDIPPVQETKNCEREGPSNTTYSSRSSSEQQVPNTNPTLFSSANSWRTSSFFSSSSHPVAQLNSAFLLKVDSNAYKLPTLPPVSDLSIGTLPCSFRLPGGSTDGVDPHSTLVEVRGSGRNDIDEKVDPALLEKSLQEKPLGVVLAASFATADRFAAQENEDMSEDSLERNIGEKRFLFSKGVGVLGGDGSHSDRCTSHSGVAWGSSSSSGAPLGATATKGQGGVKFGSELDYFLILHSPGLVVVWVLLPTVHTELRQRRQQHNFPKSTPRQGVHEQNTPGDMFNPTEGTYLSTISDTVVVIPLVCDADVRTILLHPTHPGVLLGGTRSGRVVWWNFTAFWSSWTLPTLTSRAIASSGAPHTLLLPCQRPCYSSFPSSGVGILRLAVLGESGDDRICAVREDGYVCMWSGPPLLRPRSVLLPTYPRDMLHCHATSASIVVAPNSSVVKVFLGTSSGAVLVGHFCAWDDKSVVYSFARSKSPTSSSDPLFTVPSSSPALFCPPKEDSSHVGPVTSISCQKGTSDSTLSFYDLNFQSSNNAHMKQNNPLFSVGSLSGALRTDVRKESEVFITCGIHGESFLWSNDAATPPLPLSTSATTAVCWSPGNPTLFAIGSNDGAIFLYSTANVDRYVKMTPSKSFENHRLSFALLQILPKQGFSYSFAPMKMSESTAPGGATGTVSAIGADKLPSLVTALQFSSDGKWLLAGYDAGCVVIFRIQHKA